MGMHVWPEPYGDVLREQLLLEGKRWNRLHQPPKTLEGWTVYRQELRDELFRLAGTFPSACDLDMQEHGVIDLDGYRIVKVTYQSRPGLRVTANLYVPDGPGPFPGILGTHGHWQQGKIADRVAARGHTFAKEGFVVLIVDAFGSGERTTDHGKYEYHGATIGGSLMSVGETLLGMQVYDNMRGIDLLQSLPYVDGERIGVTGASGGGNQTMWVAALDDRVAAAVPVVSVGTFETYLCNANCVCEMLPEGLTVTEEWGILALTAPGALLILNAMRDSNRAFQVSEMMRSFESARGIYALLGLEDRIDYKAIDLPHGYWPEMRRHALGWFKYWLKGEGTGRACDIPEIPIIPEDDLLCFEKGKRPEDVRSIVSYVTEKGAELKSQFLESTKAGELDADTKREELEEILKLRDTSLSVFPGPVVEGTACGRPAEFFSVDISPGTVAPCVRVLPMTESAGDRVVIAVHPEGKSAAAEQPEIKKCLEEGVSVCFADLRNIGETRWDGLTAGRFEHEAARTALWLGRTMIGEWTEDLMALTGVFKAQELDVELYAWGTPALAALATGVLTESLSTIVVGELLASYALDGSPQTGSMGAFLPGILTWGDVTLLAALATCSVQIAGLVTASGNSLSETAQNAWLQEARGVAEALGTHTDISII